MSLYIICTSARTGGNLLCSTLAQTGLLGQPGSYLCAYPLHDVLNKLTRSEFEQYLNNVPERLHQEQDNATLRSNDLAWLYESNLLENLGSPIDRLLYFYNNLKAPNMQEYLNNIRQSDLGGEYCGLKILAHDSYGLDFDYFVQNLTEEQPNASKTNSEALFHHIGDVKYIWLTRRNKIRQGLSRWKAMHTNKWHQKQLIEPHDDVDDSLPTMDELNKHVVQLTLDDAYWQEYFSKNRITPLTVVYEDFVLDPELTIKQILNYLAIKPCKEHYFNGFNEYKMANANSDEFVNRFYESSNIW